LFSLSAVAVVALSVSLPAVADAKPAFHATAADNGICTVMVTASWSGARVNAVEFTMTTNAATYTSAPALLGGPSTIQTSGFLRYTFSVNAADASGVGRADFLSAKGRIVGSAATDPVQFACS
jgi:hypothetical protein